MATPAQLPLFQPPEREFPNRDRVQKVEKKPPERQSTVEHPTEQRQSA